MTERISLEGKVAVVTGGGLVEQLRPLARVLLIQARRQLAAEARATMMNRERAA